MGKDFDFKTACNIIGYEKVSKGEVWSDFYSPDIVFKKKCREKAASTMLFVESSSTGDRKVHIGEIAQFVAYISENIDKTCEVEYTFMLFLAGKKTKKTVSPPTAYNEKDRVLFYFEVLASDEVKNRVNGVYVIDQEDKGVNIRNLTIEGLKDWKIWPSDKT